jgi:hypothetical protein
MSSPTLEAFLARLYTDGTLLREFLADAQVAAREAGLDSDEIAALDAMDRDSLMMAARSFRAKRAAQAMPANAKSRGWRRALDRLRLSR